MGFEAFNLPILKKDNMKPVAAVTMVDLPGRGVVASAQKVDEWKNLTPDQRQLVNEKLQFCQSVVTVINEQGLSQGSAAALIATNTDLYPHLHKAGKRGASALTLRNFQQWSKQLGWRKGLKTIDGSRRDALLPRYSTAVKQRAGSPEFWQIFMKNYMSQKKMSMRNAYMTARDVYLAHIDRKESEVPSMAQVRYYYENHVPRVAILEARHGSEYITNNVLSYIERDWTGVNPGDCFIGDHRKLDVAIRTWDEDKQKWISQRPWMTAWMDAKSLKFVGILIRVVEYPNGVAIEDSLISAIRANYNIPPRHIYVDNGQDYRAKGFSIPVEIGGKEFSICNELGIKVHFSTPYNGRAKTIERMFKELAEGIDKASVGYLGNRPGARPEWAQMIWKNPEELPNLQVFSEFAAAWMENVYNKTSCSRSKITGGLPPETVWQNRKVDYSRQMTDKDLYFATLRPLKTTRKVGRGACVTISMKERGLKQARFECPELWKHFNQNVIIKIDVFSIDHVWAFTLDGRLIGECTRVQLVPALANTPEERQLVADGIAKQKGQARDIREIVARETGQMQVCIPDVREMLATAASGLNVIDMVPTTKRIADKHLNMDEREDIQEEMNSERPSAPKQLEDGVTEEQMNDFLKHKFNKGPVEKVSPEVAAEIEDFNQVMNNNQNETKDNDFDSIDEFTEIDDFNKTLKNNQPTGEDDEW